MLIPKLVVGVNGVASGKTATANIPIGQRIHTITLAFGYDGSNASKETRGTSANQILGDIRLKLDGKTQRVFTAKQLNLYNCQNGDPIIGRIIELTDNSGGTANDTIQAVSAAYAQAEEQNNFADVALKLNQIIRTLTFGSYGMRTAGTMGSTGYREYLTIFLSEPWRKGVNAQQASAWNLDPRDVGSCQIEVDFQTITSPALDIFYTADPLTDRLGRIEKVSRQTVTLSGSSKDIVDLSIPRTDALRALLCFATSDNHYVNKARLTINGQDVQELLDYLQKRALLSNYGMNPDLYANSTTEYLSPSYNIPLDFDDPLNNVYPGSQIASMNLHVELDSSSSGTMDVLVCRDGPKD